MKTKVRKSNRTKKAAKVRRSSRAAKTPVAERDVSTMMRLWRLAQGIPEESPEHGSEFWTEWKLSDLLALLALGLNTNYAPCKGYVTQRKTGLTEPAALPVADPVTGEHPGSLGSKLTQLAERVDDLAMFAGFDRRLLSSWAAAQSELEARVAVAEARLDSLLHNEAQVPDFYKCSIAGNAFATPLYEVPSYLSGDLAWNPNLHVDEKGTDSVPSVPAPGKGEGTGSVPLGEETGNPAVESFVPLTYGPCALQSSSPLPEPSRFTRLVRKCVAKARAVLHAVARCVSKL